MKKNKNFFAILMAMLLCVSTTCVTTYAAESSLEASNLATSDAEISPQSVDILTDGDYLVNSNRVYTINIPKSTTYTVTLSVRQVSGSGGIWMQLYQRYPYKIDTVVYDRYQQRVYLEAGTYTLLLSSTNGSCSYGITIHQTF